MENWKVRVYEAHSPLEEQRAGKPAAHVDNFGVTGETPDDAKRAAEKFIRDTILKGQFRLRALSHSATEPRTMIAYIQKESAR